MAVQIVRSPHDYIGYSTELDDKRVAPEGSTFTSIDTGETWLMHEEMWIPDLRNVCRKGGIPTLQFDI